MQTQNQFNPTLTPFQKHHERKILKTEIIEELTETVENLEWALKKVEYRQQFSPKLTKETVEMHHIRRILKNSAEILNTYIPEIKGL